MTKPEDNGFPHGTVVRRRVKPSNLLVVRWLGETTTVLSPEVDETGILTLGKCLAAH